MNREDWFDTAKVDRHWEGGSCRIVDDAIEFALASKRMEFLYRDRMTPGNRYRLKYTQAITDNYYPNPQWTMILQLHGGLNTSPCLGFNVLDDGIHIEQRLTVGDLSEDLYHERMTPHVANEWEIEILVSSGIDGELKIWRDGDMIINKPGPNIYRDSVNLSFKFGLYAGGLSPRCNRVRCASQELIN